MTSLISDAHLFSTTSEQDTIYPVFSSVSIPPSIGTLEPNANGTIPTKTTNFVVTLQPCDYDLVIHYKDTLPQIVFIAPEDSQTVADMKVSVTLLIEKLCPQFSEQTPRAF